MFRAFGIAVVAVGVVVIAVLLRRILQENKREAALSSGSFRDDWRKILRRRVPLYERLPEESRGVVESHVVQILGRKSFEACGGLEEVTEEIKLTIAGNAALLLVGHPGGEPFPSLRSILVYPGSFSVPGENEGEARRDLLGESWETGSVILSADTVLEDADAGADGFNLVLHEFSHQLDQDFGHADGLPLLEHSKQYQRWAATFSQAFERHERRTAKGWETVIDPYGAENPAEFFACATETFFERPEELRSEIPFVFEEFVNYYRVDPTHWK